MPIEEWIKNYVVAKFLYDWQTLVAGFLAVLAALGTIRATIRAADREIAAGKEQTAVAQKQIETTVGLARTRAEDEASAFRAVLEAAMRGVLAEVAWAKTTYPNTLTQDVGSSVDALVVRNCITKGAFAELRGACVRQGSPLTGEFLDLECEIDNFALQWVDTIVNAGVPIREGKHAGLGDQINVIERKAAALRVKAAQDPWGFTWPGRAGASG
jgi:hypothetical protein